MNILGVIQARGGSKGIPKKNIYNICGHPLIAYTIAAGLGSKLITDLVVSTDSDEIAEVAKKYGALVPFKRPEELAGDKVPSVDSLVHAVLETERILGKIYDYVVELPCVSPLRNAADIDEALNKLIVDGCDSVISMTDTGEKHPTRLKKIEYDQIVDMTKEYPEPAVGSRRQDLKPIAYIRNGAIYSMRRDVLIKEHSRHGKVSRPYIMSPETSINIDTMLDLEIAEFFISKGRCINKPRVKFRLLITTPLHFLPDILTKYKETAECVVLGSDTSVADIKMALAQADGWVCSPCPQYVINDDILKYATKLKFIASTSTGTNHIDVEYCKSNKIKILSLREDPNLSTITASSEFTFGLMLATVRKIPQAFDNVKNGKWRDAEDQLRSIELAGKTLGIIGYGRIGSNNAKYAKAFGMNVVVYDPYVKINDPNIQQVSFLANVLSKADVVMVCVHLSPETKGMVNHHWFNLMKSGAIFINTSRGEVVDEHALLENLYYGKLAAAGLDVLADEANIGKNTNKLIEYAKQHNNLIITSHIAGLTYDSERKAAEIILEKVKREII